MVRHAEFSGVVQVRSEVETVFAEGYGYANRADRLPNTINTRFGIASGTKLLTGVAICQLVEEGGLALETRLQDVVDAAFPQFDPAITVRHLLTHTSGAPDYFDEEDSATAEYGELWTNRPTYTMRRLRDFLPMFQNEPMKYAPGERFSYNNGGYILLGLIIEAITGRTYIDYVTEHVLLRAGMADSGFYPLDQLPERTALGYVDLEDGSWRTNTFELPIIGASDGGVFATAPDVGHFWDALFAYRLLGPEMTMQFLHPHVATDPTEDNTRYYGYGIWMRHADGKPIRYYGVGSDPGASFMSARFPAQLVEVTVISNTGDGAWPVFEGIKALI
jgi:CubicO group peptidase (beta-lactamase class C family)